MIKKNHNFCQVYGQNKVQIGLDFILLVKCFVTQDYKEDSKQTGPKAEGLIYRKSYFQIDNQP